MVWLIHFAEKIDNPLTNYLCDLKLSDGASAPQRATSQAISWIADRTASQHFQGSRDVIGYVTIWYHIGHFLLVVLWNGVSISSRFQDIGFKAY